MFCKKCGSLMRPINKKLQCTRCGAESEINAADRATITEKGRNSETKVIDGEGTQGTLPKTNIECEKCGHNEAYFVIRQTRAADEPETMIYECCKCGSRWRRY